jgi:signal transduction histidine kinase
LRATGSSLRGQLLRWVVPPVLAVLVVSSVASYFLALKFANDAYDGGLFDQGRSIAEQIRFGPRGEASIDLPPAAREILVGDPYDRIFFRVLDATGRTLDGDAGVPPPKQPPTAEYPLRFYDARIEGQKIRAAAYSVFSPTGDHWATVLFAETLVKRQRLTRDLLFTVVVPQVLLVDIGVALLWFGIRRGLAPLERLAKAVSQRGWGDLSDISDSGSLEEVRPLTQAINDLMNRLSTALTAQQRFIADAAHQLRTPLAGLSAQADRALREQDVETLKNALKQLQSSSKRVTRLVNQLLMLARAEPAGDPARGFRPLDLVAVVQRTCMDWVPEALSREVDLGFSGKVDAVMMEGDEMLLGEMLSNLIDNALRYGARRGGHVTVSITATPRIRLAVEDDGPGIPEAERLRVFERFHRIPGSPPGGVGLGLAIVREIARAHGAEVSVAPAGARGGTVFSVLFGAG